MKQNEQLPDPKPIDNNSETIGVPSSESDSLQDKAGELANNWLARNRNLVLRQTPVWAQSLSLILMALGGIAIVGGIFFRIDEVVTVNGQLRSLGGTVEVKTPAGGRVEKVLFKDGQLVQEGDLLLIFDTTKAALEKETLTRLIQLESAALKSRLSTLESQSEMLAARSLVFAKKLQTKMFITEELQKLVDQGGFQRINFLEQKDQLFELQKQLSEVSEQINQNKLQADQTRLDASKNLNQMRSGLKQAELQLQYQNVVAPITGIVFDPKANPEGVLPAGERILSLVPQKGLYAEVLVPNADIGFVKAGQKAKVRVDAFPFSRYGELDGVVEQISADALKPDSTTNY